jgi:ubiquinol-cytochrome c reductase cytochrome b subunit
VIAIPLVLLGLVAAHVIALHEVGSNNPDGVEIKKDKDANGIPLDGIPFHPYYTVHDLFGVAVFLIRFARLFSSRRKWAATSSKPTTSSRPIR